jgi:hypothetical protein
MPDVDVLASLMEESLAELVAASDALAAHRDNGASSAPLTGAGRRPAAGSTDGRRSARSQRTPSGRGSAATASGTGSPATAKSPRSARPARSPQGGAASGAPRTDSADRHRAGPSGSGSAATTRAARRPSDASPEDGA